MYSIYILRCKGDNSYYVGATKDIEKRLKRHAKGEIKFTKSRLPVKLIYKEDYLTFKEAFKREKQIKSWKKRRAIENLIKRKTGPIVYRNGANSESLDERRKHHEDIGPLVDPIMVQDKKIEDL